MISHRKLVLSTINEDAAVNFLQEHSILRKTWTCDQECGIAYIKLRRKDEGFYFYCSKCGGQKSIKVDGFLKNSNLSYVQFIDFLYFWCIDCNQEILRKESEITSMNTSGKWAQRFRMICEETLLELDDGMIGGLGVEVEIDESKFSKRKYNRGRVLSDGWVFGGIERGTKNSFFEFVQDRSEKTLMAVVRRRIRQGTIIHSDMWGAYRNISLHGYKHMTVNHSENFVDPETGSNTQTIESAWSHLKQNIRVRGRHLMAKSEYFAEYLYKRRYKGYVFDRILVDIAEKYPIN